MSFFGKVYNFVKHENFDSWMKAHGLPDERIQAFLAQKPFQKFDKNGDSYTITQTSSSGEKVTSFKSGVEFEDTIGDDKIPIKTTYTVDGDTVTQVVKSTLGDATFKRVFSGDDLVVTITSNKYDGVAKRYYKA